VTVNLTSCRGVGGIHLCAVAPRKLQRLRVDNPIGGYSPVTFGVHTSPRLHLELGGWWEGSSFFSPRLPQQHPLGGRMGLMLGFGEVAACQPCQAARCMKVRNDLYTLLITLRLYFGEGRCPTSSDRLAWVFLCSGWVFFGTVARWLVSCREWRVNSFSVCVSAAGFVVTRLCISCCAFSCSSALAGVSCGRRSEKKMPRAQAGLQIRVC